MNAIEAGNVWLASRNETGAAIARLAITSLQREVAHLKDEVQSLRWQVQRLADGVPFGVTDEEWSILAELRAVFR